MSIFLGACLGPQYFQRRSRSAEVSSRPAGAEAMLLARMFSGHWFSVLIVCAPIVVHALKECSKVDVCKCSTDEGVIDLWSLAGTGSDIPRLDSASLLGVSINFLVVYQ